MDNGCSSEDNHLSYQDEIKIITYLTKTIITALQIPKILASGELALSLWTWSITDY